MVLVYFFVRKISLTFRKKFAIFLEIMYVQCSGTIFFSFFVRISAPSASAWFTHVHGTTLPYKLPCLKIVLRVLVDTRGHRRERRKKGSSRGSFRDRTTFAPQGQNGRCERSTDAAADIRPDAGAYDAPLLSIYVPRDP